MTLIFITPKYNDKICERVDWFSLLKLLGITPSPKNIKEGYIIISCPCHKEKHPSMNLYENGFYKCHGCGEHGNIFTFVMKIKKIRPDQALRFFKKHYNIELTTRRMPRQ